MSALLTGKISDTGLSAAIDDDSNFSELHSSSRIAFRHAIFNWCLRNAQRCHDKKQSEEGLNWDVLAGCMAHLDCATLSSPLLESHLTDVALSLPVPEMVRLAPLQNQRRWLHVLNAAMPVGGHTAMAARWITLDPERDRHSVLLLEQREGVPPSLLDATVRTGGEVKVLDPDDSIIDRALQLRNYAWQEADVVVLHITPFDVISTVALSIPGGPPVAFVNHAAHIFWVGCSVADLVLNCRGSLLENDWTVRYRGIDSKRSVILPIPLPSPSSSYEKDNQAEIRKKAKEALSLPSDALVVLTVGNSFKYKPLPGIDFLDAAVQIFQEREDVYLIAVGVDENARWKAIREKFGGRLLAVGQQLDLSRFHAVADVYIEGFPFGSTTAILEAGMRGIPCVLAPAICPPPFTSDGLALEALARPVDLKDYIRSIIALLDDSCERRRIGCLLAASITAHHGDAGWIGYLNAIKQKLPASHNIHTINIAHSIPADIANYWSAFSSQMQPDPLLMAVKSAIRLGLKPKLDRQLREAVLVTRSFRKHCELIDMLAILIGPISTWLPFVTSWHFYVGLFSIFRPGGKIMRLRSKVELILGYPYKHLLPAIINKILGGQ